MLPLSVSSQQAHGCSTSCDRTSSSKPVGLHQNISTIAAPQTVGRMAVATKEEAKRNCNVKAGNSQFLIPRQTFQCACRAQYMPSLATGSCSNKAAKGLIEQSCRPAKQRAVAERCSNGYVQTFSSDQRVWDSPKTMPGLSLQAVLGSKSQPCAVRTVQVGAGQECADISISGRPQLLLSGPDRHLLHQNLQHPFGFLPSLWLWYRT